MVYYVDQRSRGLQSHDMVSPSRSFQILGVVCNVISNEGGNKVVTVIVSLQNEKGYTLLPLYICFQCIHTIYTLFPYCICFQCIYTTLVSNIFHI